MQTYVQEDRPRFDDDGDKADVNRSEETVVGCTSSSAARLGFVDMLLLAWQR